MKRQNITIHGSTGTIGKNTLSVIAKASNQYKVFALSAKSKINTLFNQIKKFSLIGEKIGLLFQIADDLIDHSSTSKIAGKKTNKDSKKGKATLISLLGYKNAIKYASKLKKEIFSSLVGYGNNASDLKETIEFILSRNK